MELKEIKNIVKNPRKCHARHFILSMFETLLSEKKIDKVFNSFLTEAVII